MKIAISLPDDLFAELERCARELRLSRSALLAKAAREFLARHGAGDATERWNGVIEASGQPGDEPAARALRARSRQSVRRRRERW